MNSTTVVHLKKGKEESLKRFHPWIFSGAIHHTSGKDPQDGDIVDVITFDDKFIARGHCQLGSIAVRVLTFEDEIIDLQWWHKMIKRAYDMRVSLGIADDNKNTTCYRLVHGEGDFLPGLVIDIYGDTAVFQAHSVGMYLAKEDISKSLIDVFGGKLKAVYDKSSSTLPKCSEIDCCDSYICGLGQEGICVLENGLKFSVNWREGQKTGFFIDQRENRELVKKYAKGRKVLNTFCYTGGFSVYALSGGASSVDSIDSSNKAVEMAIKNVEINFPGNSNHCGITADAIEYLKNIEKDKYDLIILDPPAFAKHRNVISNALNGYKRINYNAIKNIASGGVLFTFSCSQAVSKEQFRNTVFSAAAMAGRNVKILHQMTQPFDHPVNIYHPEGEYLKGLILYIE